MSNAWFLSLWLIVSTVSAGEPPVDLDHALRRYQNVERLHVRFEQTKRLRDLDYEIRSRGDLEWAPERLLWRIHSPAPTSVEFKNGELRVGDQAQAVSDNYRREMERMLSWIRFDAGTLKKDFAISRASPTVFEFTPKEPGGAFKSMRLTLNAKGFAERVELNEVSDDRLILTFSPPVISYRR